MYLREPSQLIERKVGAYRFNKTPEPPPQRGFLRKFSQYRGRKVINKITQRLCSINVSIKSVNTRVLSFNSFERMYNKP